MTTTEIPLVAGQPDYLHALLKICGNDISTLLEVVRSWRRQASRHDRVRLTKDEIAARLIADPVLLKRLLDRVREQE